VREKESATFCIKKVSSSLGFGFSFVIVDFARCLDDSQKSECLMKWAKRE
jgi:hypothetical protein